MYSAPSVLPAPRSCTCSRVSDVENRTQGGRADAALKAAWQEEKKTWPRLCPVPKKITCYHLFHAHAQKKSRIFIICAPHSQRAHSGIHRIQVTGFLLISYASLSTLYFTCVRSSLQEVAIKENEHLYQNLDADLQWQFCLDHSPAVPEQYQKAHQSLSMLELSATAPVMPAPTFTCLSKAPQLHHLKCAFVSVFD